MEENVTSETGSDAAEIDELVENDGAESRIAAVSRGDEAGAEVPTVKTIDAVEPAISAIIVTYNHERYIEQALDSVLSQQTDFPFEVIISEDRSTDSTGEIVKSYVERDPGRIRLMRSEDNLRSIEVVLRAMRAARGRYITLLDGDDYWVSPDKLQAQFDFMEAHPDSAITYHDVERVTDDGEVIRVMKGLGHRGTIADLTTGNFLGTCSVMIRHSALPEVPDWVRDMPAGDWPLYLLAARSGFIDHIDGLVARYRIHGESYWATRPLSEQILLGLCMQIEIEAHLGPSYAALFEKSRRDTARHVLSTVLKEPTEEQTAASGDAELSSPQAAASVKATRIRLIEMQTRINEAEAKRSEAQWRVDVVASQLHTAEAGRDEAWRHAGNLATQMASSQAAIADVMARHADLTARHADLMARHSEAIEKLRRSEARAHAAEAHGRQLQDALETAHRKTEFAETQAELAEARGQDLQAAVHASTTRVRRIRRREKRIAIGLGLVIAGLVAFIVHLQWI
ncbi:Glycosyl transferase family 2 [Kaistia soli DSM 19436]|uniref:Glycosyl transferase family 2 n=1 Tax=Kaistia soli DSM 19436 TaxID=1122133 RepID=A0A1M4ZZV7_9HYPH|nr:glycosyltransferase [Kaistia soli]SHF23252.1 Glycosyl transferase family 2 [Kaistia soli DSM 19436]